MKYDLIENDITIYTRKKRWSEFSTTSKVSGIVDYHIEFEDFLTADCIISVYPEHNNRRRLYSNFLGRDKLGCGKS